VKNDTLINGKSYHIIAEYNFLTMSVPIIRNIRDSADCVVDDKGDLLFSINSSAIIKTNILTPDTIAYVDYSYSSNPTSITVPSGTYSCGDFKGALYRKMDNFQGVHYTHKYCYKNIGIIKRTVLSVGSLQEIKFELVSYHVQ
jgi:hypothetical protein